MPITIAKAIRNKTFEYNHNREYNRNELQFNEK